MATERKSQDAPELMYFNGPGRANLTRLAFAAGGVQFVDTRVENWPDVKADPSSTPAQLFGQMPCVKHGGLLVGQSLATATYAAELGIWAEGRLGGDSVTVAKNRAVEVMVATTNEALRGLMYKCLFGDDASKAAGASALPAAAAPILQALERVLERKTTKGPFFFSQAGPSLADLAVYDNITSPFPGLRALGVDLTPYPLLAGVVSAVDADPRIRIFVSPETSLPVPPAHKIKLYTNAICPFAQRAWMALLEKGLDFETILIPLSGEINKFEAEGATSGDWAGHSLAEVKAIKAEYKKTVNATGEVPTLVHGDSTIAEADVVAEYISDAFPATGTSLMPTDAVQRAKVRAMAKVLGSGDGVMALYQLLKNQDPAADQDFLAKIHKHHTKFASLADPVGPFFLGPEPCILDVLLAPFYMRFNILLPHYRAVDYIPAGDDLPWAARLRAWAAAMDQRQSFITSSAPVPAASLIHFYVGYAGARGRALA